MYEAYQYTANSGVSLRHDYASEYMGKKGKCQQGYKVHFQNIDSMEVDGMTNESMKSVVLKQPFGVGIYTSGMLMSYSSGVVTEEYLHCSNLRWSVNHGVVLVGYGKVEGEKLKGHCKECGNSSNC